MTYLHEGEEKKIWSREEMKRLREEVKTLRAQNAHLLRHKVAADGRAAAFEARFEELQRTAARDGRALEDEAKKALLLERAVSDMERRVAKTAEERDAAAVEAARAEKQKKREKEARLQEMHVSFRQADRAAKALGREKEVEDLYHEAEAENRIISDRCRALTAAMAAKESITNGAFRDLDRQDKHLETLEANLLSTRTALLDENNKNQRLRDTLRDQKTTISKLRSHSEKSQPKNNHLALIAASDSLSAAARDKKNKDLPSLRAALAASYLQAGEKSSRSSHLPMRPRGAVNKEIIEA